LLNISSTTRPLQRLNGLVVELTFSNGEGNGNGDCNSNGNNDGKGDGDGNRDGNSDCKSNDNSDGEGNGTAMATETAMTICTYVGNVGNNILLWPSCMMIQALTNKQVVEG
jgi:hypothetical protein